MYDQIVKTQKFQNSIAEHSVKNQVQRTRFLPCKTGYTGSKNPVQNRLKIQFIEFDFSNLVFQKSSTDG